MISFFAKIFSGITTVIVSVVISLGLMSAPAKPQTSVIIEPTSTSQEQTVSTRQNLPVESKPDSNLQKTAQQKNFGITKIVSPSQSSLPVVVPTGANPLPQQSAPIVTSTPTPTSQPPTQTYVPIYMPTVAPTPTPSSAPTPQPTPSPSPAPSEPSASGISIQNQVCNLSQTNLKTEYYLYDLLQNGNTDGRIFMNAYILNQQGQNYYNSNPTAAMTVTTSNHSNDKTLNGSGNTGPCGYYYPYEFYATQAGTYTITYSVPSLNLSKTITLNVKLPEKPIIGSSGNIPLSETSTQYWFQASKPENQYLTLSAWCSDADTAFTKVEIVSSFNSSDGLYYYRGRFSSGGQFSGTTTCKFVNSADSSMSIFSESDPTTFNVQ